MKKFFLMSLIVFAFTSCGSSDGSSEEASAEENKGIFGTCYGTSDQTCTGVEDYEDCIIEECDSDYQDCFGEDYMSGNWSGPCASYLNCVMACDCNDTGCATNCAINAAGDCTTCLTSVGACVQASGCTQPECESTNGGQQQGGGNCDDLAECCDTIQEALKLSCDAIVDAGVDQACDVNLQSFTAAGYCN